MNWVQISEWPLGWIFEVSPVSKRARTVILPVSLLPGKDHTGRRLKEGQEP